MKQCTKCKTWMPEESFEMQQKRGRRRSTCRACRTAEQRVLRAKRKANPPKQTQETKMCSHCKVVKPVSEFSPANTGYFQSRCKDCLNSIHRTHTQEQRIKDNRTWYQAYVNVQGILVKGCSKCRIEKPVSEFYPMHNRYHSKCKDCDRTDRKAYYHADPEKERAASREYARTHPEECKARFMRWYANHKTHRRQYRRGWYTMRCKQINAYRRQRYKDRTLEQRQSDALLRRNNFLRLAEQTKEIRRERNRRWRQQNPEKHADNAIRYRARKMNAPRIEKIDRKAIIERDKWICYLCLQICTPQNVTLDHVVPLFHGGTHTADNLRVACFSCNCRKGAKHPRDFFKE